MIYTGFFDAAFDEETGTYDREYDSTDFVGYFEQIVGSGVCVYSNDDSMKVYYDSASQRAVVNPGYLFIRGYWLKNDGLYTVSLEDLSEGTYAIRAVLSMSARSISIGQVAKAEPEEYPDALVLAYATIDANNAVTVEDTRGRTDICGLIDAAGSLSQKVAYAINYINNEIDAKLEQIKEDLQAQEAIIDGKIEEANGLIAKIAPPAVGTIKFSASQDVGEEWLRCDGRFVNEVDYPELVAALGKNYPSGDKFQLLNTGGVGTQISNGVVCEGRLWVFSYSDRKLYGIDVEGSEAPKIITLEGDENFNNWQSPNSNFLALSIIPNLLSEGNHRIFLSQINKSGKWDYTSNLVYSAEFSGSESNLVLSVPFTGDFSTSKDGAIPYVISKQEGNVERFYMLVSYTHGTVQNNSDISATTVLWSSENDIATASTITLGSYEDMYNGGMSHFYISSYNSKNHNEAVFLITDYERKTGNTSGGQSLTSLQEGMFDREKFSDESISSVNFSYDSSSTCIVAGLHAVLLQISPDLNKVKVISREKLEFAKDVSVNVSLPLVARPFIDASAYLWGKDIYIVFVGTGVLFSRDLTEGSFGYLDTTSILGTITQYASLQYSQDEGVLYLVGQDTTNTIRAAKIVLNTLYDYASDGAWLPLIASDGIPAYIKAIGELPPPPPPDPVVFKEIKIMEVTESGLPSLISIFNVTFDDETMVGGKEVEFQTTGTVVKMTALQDYTNPTQQELIFSVKFGYTGYNNSEIASPLIGKVLAKGESIKKGDEVQTTINMGNLYDLYGTQINIYVFYHAEAGQ